MSNFGESPSIGDRVGNFVASLLMIAVFVVAPTSMIYSGVKNYWFDTPVNCETYTLEYEVRKIDDPTLELGQTSTDR